MEDVDVVIVGAGSSGLAAAKVLRAAGLTFKVFEAMGRIGSGPRRGSRWQRASSLPASIQR